MHIILRCFYVGWKGDVRSYATIPPLSLRDISYTMPTLGAVARSRQQEQSLLTWKVHLFPKYTATSRDLSSYAQ